MNRIVLVAMACLMVCLSRAWSGTLRISEWIVEENQVTVPIVLAGDVGDGVAALNFRFAYDAAVFRPVAVQAGSAASAGDKQVLADLRVPGEYNVIMMGINQNTVQSGEVVRVILERIGDPQGGQTSISVTRPTLASLEGLPMSSEGSSQTLTFGTRPPGQGDNDRPDRQGGDRPTTDGSTRPNRPGTADANRIVPTSGSRATAQKARRRTASATGRDGVNVTASRSRFDRESLAVALREAESRRGELADGVSAPGQMPVAGAADEQVDGKSGTVLSGSIPLTGDLKKSSGQQPVGYATIESELDLSTRESGAKTVAGVGVKSTIVAGSLVLCAAVGGLILLRKRWTG